MSRAVSVTGPAVVSLVPSVTETLLSWGVVPAGVTRFCEQPSLPALGGTKNPDVAAIVALGADLVVMDREENRLEDAEALRAAGLRVLDLHVRDIADLPRELRRLADAVGLPACAPASSAADGPLAGDPVERFSDVRVWVPIWRRPWMTIGAATYGSTLLTRAGMRNVFADAPDAYPALGPAEAAGRRPDAVLAPSEPYPFSERHRAELEAVAPVVFVDGKDLFWWGARTDGARHRLHALAAGLSRRGEGPGGPAPHDTPGRDPWPDR